MRARILICASLVLLLVGGAHAQRKLLETPYGNSLSDCVARAGLKTTAALIAASNEDVTSLFTNPKLSLTFFAPDDATWAAIAKAAKTPVNTLITRPGFAEYFLQNHLLSKPYLTSYWPSLGQAGKYLPALDGTSLQLWADTQYTNRVMYLYGTKTRLACQMSNLLCGNSIMHVIVDPELPTQRK